MAAIMSFDTEKCCHLASKHLSLCTYAAAYASSWSIWFTVWSVGWFLQPWAWSNRRHAENSSRTDCAAQNWKCQSCAACQTGKPVVSVIYFTRVL